MNPENDSKHPFCDKVIDILTTRLYDDRTKAAIIYAMTESFDTEEYFDKNEIDRMASFIQEEVALQIRRGEQHPELKSWGKFKNMKLYREAESK